MMLTSTWMIPIVKFHLRAEFPNIDEEPVITMDIYDPSNFGSLDNKARDILVEKRPKRDEKTLNIR
uniref:Uncharacterized protein n=1 Tax=Aegilops tauschii subsp. strangulata TaxID=200361 RepID=A0A453QM76_AEGTS